MSVASLYDLGDLRAGNMEVFIASKPSDIEASQALRYRVFVEEMGAKPSAAMVAQKSDFDEFDSVCDHLLVAEHRAAGDYHIVGTYRFAAS